MSDTFTRAIDEFVHSPIEVIAAVTVIAAAVSAAFKAGRRFWTNMWLWLRGKPAVPSETLRIVQDVRQSRWSYASVNGNPAMQVIFEGHVTNTSARPNRVLRAEIPKPLTHALMLKLSDNHNAGRPQVLSPYECTDLFNVFYVQPVVGQERKPWQTSVIFIDQYGNRHKIKNCVFTAVPSPPNS